MENISTVVIVIHLMVVLALVVIVLLQRSEGGALGMGGGGGGLMSARGAANALTRTTGILAAAFFVTSLTLGILAKLDGSPTDILDTIPANQTVPATDGGEIPLGTGSGGILKQLPKAKPEAPSNGVPDSQ